MISYVINSTIWFWSILTNVNLIPPLELSSQGETVHKIHDSKLKRYFKYGELHPPVSILDLGQFI